MKGKYVKEEHPCGERKSLAVVYLDWFNQKTAYTMKENAGLNLKNQCTEH